MEYDVVMLPSFARVMAWRKQRADAREAGSFAQVVTTFDAWIADLWELYGNGRSIVDDTRREVLLTAIFKEATGALPTGGVVEQAVICLRAASGLSEFECALAAARRGERIAGISEREAAFLKVLALYEDRLEDLGAIEPGMAAALLACGHARGLPSACGQVRPAADDHPPAEAAPADLPGRAGDDSSLAGGDGGARLSDEAGWPGRSERGAGALAAAAEEDLPGSFRATAQARPLAVLAPDCPPLPEVQRRFFAEAGFDVAVAPAAGADGVTRAPADVDVRFAFPTGRLAQPGLIGDLVEEYGERGDVIVACKDPLDAYDRLEARLAGAGRRVGVQARKPFSQTDFGRAYLALGRCLRDETWDVAALSDVLASPFSGFAPSEAARLDAVMRCDRLMSREEALAGLRALSEPFSQLEELAGDPDADVLIGVFEQEVQTARHRSAAWRAEQLQALSTLRGVTTAARRAGAGIAECLAVLERATVPVSAQTAGTSGSVRFTTLAAAAQEAPASCAVLIACDLTSQDYPVAEREDAASTLLAALGLPPEEGALSRARREFSAAVRLPSSLLCLVRPLGDDDANPTYPCIVLEEFADAHRASSAAPREDGDGPRAPAEPGEGSWQRGEETLFANALALPAQAAQPGGESPNPPLADLSNLAARQHAAPSACPESRQLPGDAANALSEQAAQSAKESPPSHLVARQQAAPFDSSQLRPLPEGAANALPEQAVLPRDGSSPYNLAARQQAAPSACPEPRQLPGDAAGAGARRGRDGGRAAFSPVGRGEGPWALARGVGATAGAWLSPSQIEVYLECPFRWFAQYRLRPKTLDEGFGPLERGQFAHGVLESFYRRFQERGELKVSERNVGEARKLMREVADEALAAQPGLEPHGGRLVAATELERREADSFCEQLVSFLDFEKRLLPAFHPGYLEFAIGEDRPVVYAGRRLAGKVDRIDVDDAGRAVIIDYKSSVGSEHAIAGKMPGHAGKVQALVYAQAVKRLLGLDVVAALYVSFGRRPTVAGAFDPRALDVAHLPGLRPDECSCGFLDKPPERPPAESSERPTAESSEGLSAESSEGLPAESTEGLLAGSLEETSAGSPEGFSLADLSFPSLLDMVENLAGGAAEAMAAGDIEPRPSHPGACSYCPVLACPKRSA